MTMLVDIQVDEHAARAELRRQIGFLEVRGGRAPGSGRGPALLSLGELEAVRDALASASSGHLAGQGPANCPLDVQGARRLLEAMFADPRAHKFVTVSRADAGLPGCGAYRVKPRLGVIGMLAGWWEITLSSGCP